MEESKPTETSELLTVFNKTIHHEDDSSEDKSVTEFESPTKMGSKIMEKRTSSLQPIFMLKWKTKVEGLITYSTDQQILKFKVKSGNNQELWGENADSHHMN